MTISVNCPECGKTLKAKESAAGKKAKCPACGGTIQIPEVVEAVDAEAAEDDYGGGPNFDDFSGMEDSGAAVEREPDRRPCPACGEMIAEKAAKCRFCGEIFDKTLKKKKKKKKSSSSYDDEQLTGVDWVLILICSNIGCIVGLVRLIQGNPTGGKMLGLSLLVIVIKIVLSLALNSQ